MSTDVVLALGWGAIAAAPIVLAERRRAARTRARMLGGAPGPAASVRRAVACTRVARRALAPIGALARVPARRRDSRRRVERLTTELVATVDLIGVSVGAGLTPYLALEVTRRWCGPTIGAVLGRVQERHALGASFDDALRDVARIEPAVRPLTDTLRASTRLGAPIRPALARLAADTRRDLRRRAETRARRVPVRLLFPLVFCVLPAFALLTVAPAVLAGLAGD